MKKAFFSYLIFGLSIALVLSQFACQSGSGTIKLKVENNGLQISRELTLEKHPNETSDQSSQATRSEEREIYFLKTKDSLTVQQPNLNRVSIGLGKALFEKYIK